MISRSWRSQNSIWNISGRCRKRNLNIMSELLMVMAATLLDIKCKNASSQRSN